MTLTHPDHQARDERTAELLAHAADQAEDGHRDAIISDVVVLNLPVARAVAARFHRRGIADDDLEQVASLALTRAAHNYDGGLDHAFLSYAVPTIRGELKKHFRDVGWTVRPPRRIQELQGRISPARDELTQELGRDPGETEIADAIDEPVEQVREAGATNGCFVPSSLDRPVDDGSATTLGDLLPEDGSDKSAAEARAVLGPAVDHLDGRARRIVYLRFFEDRTQQEIADELGVTQMHVSRLITQILDGMHQEITGAT